MADRRGSNRAPPRGPRYSDRSDNQYPSHSDDYYPRSDHSSHWYPNQRYDQYIPSDDYSNRSHGGYSPDPLYRNNSMSQSLKRQRSHGSIDTHHHNKSVRFDGANAPAHTNTAISDSGYASSPTAQDAASIPDVSQESDQLASITAMMHADNLEQDLRDVARLQALLAQHQVEEAQVDREMAKAQEQWHKMAELAKNFPSVRDTQKQAMLRLESPKQQAAAKVEETLKKLLDAQMSYNAKMLLVGCRRSTTIPTVRRPSADDIASDVMKHQQDKLLTYEEKLNNLIARIQEKEGQQENDEKQLRMKIKGDVYSMIKNDAKGGKQHQYQSSQQANHSLETLDQLKDDVQQCAKKLETIEENNVTLARRAEDLEKSVTSHADHFKVHDDHFVLNDGRLEKLRGNEQAYIADLEFVKNSVQAVNDEVNKQASKQYDDQMSTKAKFLEVDRLKKDVEEVKQRRTTPTSPIDPFSDPSRLEPHIDARLKHWLDQDQHGIFNELVQDSVTLAASSAKELVHEVQQETKTQVEELKTSLDSQRADLNKTDWMIGNIETNMIEELQHKITTLESQQTVFARAQNEFRQVLHGSSRSVSPVTPQVSRLPQLVASTPQTHSQPGIPSSASQPLQQSRHVLHQPHMSGAQHAHPAVPMSRPLHGPLQSYHADGINAYHTAPVSYPNNILASASGPVGTAMTPEMFERLTAQAGLNATQRLHEPLQHKINEIERAVNAIAQRSEASVAALKTDVQSASQSQAESLGIVNTANATSADANKRVMQTYDNVINLTRRVEDLERRGGELSTVPQLSTPSPTLVGSRDMRSVKADVAAIEKRLDGLEDSIASHGQGFKNIGHDVDKIDEAIIDIRSTTVKMDVFQQQIAKLAALDMTVDGIRTNLSTAKQSFESSLSALNTEIDDHARRFNNLDARAADVEQLSTTVNKQKAKANKLRKEMGVTFSVVQTVIDQIKAGTDNGEQTNWQAECETAQERMMVASSRSSNGPA